MNSESVPELIRQLQSINMPSGAAPPMGPPLNNDDGGGRFPDMEARVAKLESHMDQVRVDVSAIKERLQHLPTKDEAKTTIDESIDRMSGNLQKFIGLSATVITLILAGVALALKFLVP